LKISDTCLLRSPNFGGAIDAGQICERKRYCLEGEKQQQAKVNRTIKCFEIDQAIWIFSLVEDQPMISFYFIFLIKSFQLVFLVYNSRIYQK